MYGMVNRAIRDLVIDEAGAEVWDEIRRAAGLETDEFNDTVIYDDAVTYDLVAAASRTLGLDPASVLHEFGRHWILFTGREGWGPLFDMAGDDLRTFVAGLDALHSRVQASMPGTRMPSFTSIERPDRVLEVEYRSERDGLAPMVEGLFTGLAEHFGEGWVVEHDGRRHDAEVFLLTPVPSATPERERVEAG